MGEYTGTRLADTITCPRQSQIAVLAVTTAVATQDLRLIGTQTAKQDSGPARPGAQQKYVNFQADGGDVYVAFGVSSASLASLATATNAVNGASGCVKIPNGTTLQAIPYAGVDIFVGYLTAAGTAQLRVWVSSPE